MSRSEITHSVLVIARAYSCSSYEPRLSLCKSVQVAHTKLVCLLQPIEAEAGLIGTGSAVGPQFDLAGGQLKSCFAVLLLSFVDAFLFQRLSILFCSQHTLQH